VSRLFSYEEKNLYICLEGTTNSIQTMKKQHVHASLTLLFIVLVTLPVFSLTDPYAVARENMVTSQLQARDITHRATLQAMRTVPRHLYVPVAQRRYAYHDRPLPIGYGQTISQPYIVAYMTQIIRPETGQKVLEIGTGSGYQAAVLAGIVDQVYTIEIIEELGLAAKKVLDGQYNNVHVKIGDGYFGWEEHAPFDAIVVTAAAEYIPPPLVEQLKDGGRMIIPVGSPFQIQQLMLVEKRGENITTRSLMPVRFVPFTREKTE
jgi:protein-L-isoaspartate(D-aspartate) O-methyltransferase